MKIFMFQIQSLIRVSVPSPPRIDASHVHLPIHSSNKIILWKRTRSRIVLILILAHSNSQLIQKAYRIIQIEIRCIDLCRGILHIYSFFCYPLYSAKDKKFISDERGRPSIVYSCVCLFIYVNWNWYSNSMCFYFLFYSHKL